MENKVMHKQLIGRITTFYVVLITFGLPVVVDDGFYNITVTKSLYYYAVTSAFIIVCALCIFIGNRGLRAPGRLKTGIVDVSMLLYLFSVILSSVLSVYDDVWLGEESRYQGALTVILYVTVYFILSRYYENTDWFLIAAVAALVFVSLTGVLNCFGFDFLGFHESMTKLNKRLYISTIGNVNFYSSFICLMLPFTVCGFCSVRTKVSTIIYSIAIAVGTLGAMVTASESFAVGFVAAMVIIPFFIAYDVYQVKRFLIAVIVMVLIADVYSVIYKAAVIKYTKISDLLSIIVNPVVSFVLVAGCLIGLVILNKDPLKINLLKKIYVGAVISAVAAAVCLLIIANVYSLGSLDEYLKLNADWGNSRGAIWKQCIEIYNGFSFKEKLFGIGPETLFRVTRALNESDNMKLDQAHNEYLQYLLTVGWFGLLSYLMMISSVCYTVIKRLRKNTMAVGILAGLTSFWIQAAANIAQPFTTPLMYLFISVAGALYYKEKHKNPT